MISEKIVFATSNGTYCETKEQAEYTDLQERAEDFAICLLASIGFCESADNMRIAKSIFDERERVIALINKYKE